MNVLPQSIYNSITPNVTPNSITSPNVTPNSITSQNSTHIQSISVPQLQQSQIPMQIQTFPPLSNNGSGGVMNLYGLNINPLSGLPSNPSLGINMNHGINSMIGV